MARAGPRWPRDDAGIVPDVSHHNGGQELPMNMTQPVVRARWCDIDRIADLVTETLTTTGLGAWLVPNERRRPTILAAVARIWIEHALLFGDAFLLPNGTAATVWFHRYRPIPPPARYADRLTEACGAHLNHFLQFDQALAARRPTEAHNHLALLAAPGPAESGHAAAVLAGAQQRMDTLNLPTYAEIFTDADRKLLRRHAYTHRDVVPLDDHTTAHAMWRSSPLWKGRSSRNARSAARRPLVLPHDNPSTRWALH
ncbi:hypothetical protein [Micromonospora sp. DPT]|uniref:hypothetical protein n=1 Tax=Micromonospora sp. DPT TaxID=3142975 RepID=UPI00320B745D